MLAVASRVCSAVVRAECFGDTGNNTKKASRKGTRSYYRISDIRYPISSASRPSKVYSSKQLS